MRSTLTSIKNEFLSNDLKWWVNLAKCMLPLCM